LKPSASAEVFSSRKRNIWPWLTIVFVLTAAAVLLHKEGRSWWCSCGRAFFWTGNAWGSLTSQTFLDPYSFTHLLHGLMFCGLLTLLARRVSGDWRFCLAIMMEAVWELIENTNTVIQQYRSATAALGYQGDTVMNSLGDITCCAVGFLLARKLGWIRSLALFFITELMLLIWIRDSLLLEIVMLVSPVKAIKVWQMGH
jgi:uncharacterized membrane protein YjdF